MTYARPMTYGARVARRVAAVLLAVGLAGIAAPAQASNDSPENAVNTFWDNVQFAKPKSAVAQMLPQCRKKALPAITKLSRDIDRAIRDTDFYLAVGNYSEKVNGRNARVTYNIRLDLLGNDYYHEYIDTFSGQRWVLTGNKWFMDCSTF